MVPAEIVRNLAETVVVVRTERGRRWLEERSDRRYEADFVLRLGDATHGPRDLPA